MQHANSIHMVTGAFGYSGQYIARRLLERNNEVRTLTNSPERANSFDGKVCASQFHFDDLPKLIESLRGVSVLYNTYWVRFNHSEFQHSVAVDNTRVLFDAAREAGVQRIVHVSITNPAEDSSLEYFSGKAKLERALQQLGVSYAILRPTVLFGKEDVLVNNIAWLLRRLPIFGVFGDGRYRLQPIYVDDLAQLAVQQGESRENCILNAIGPETFTYRELVQSIGEIIGKRRPIVSVPPWLGYHCGRVVGKLMGDVVITREEIAGLMSGLLYVDAPPTGTTALTDWASQHASTLGQHYTSELARRRDRKASYQSLSTKH